MVAASIGYTYKDKLSAQEIFDNPRIDSDLLELADPIYRGIDDLADAIITDRRNRNIHSKLVSFLRSNKGKIFTRVSQRRLWVLVVKNGYRPVNTPTFGATRHFPEVNPFLGMGGLLKARRFEEALSTEVAVYRGIEEGASPTWVGQREIESWTTCREVAVLFAEGYYNHTIRPGSVTVLERKIKFGEILAFINPDDEYEIILRPEK